MERHSCICCTKMTPTASYDKLWTSSWQRHVWNRRRNRTHERIVAWNGNCGIHNGRTIIVEWAGGRDMCISVWPFDQGDRSRIFETLSGRYGVAKSHSRRDQACVAGWRWVLDNRGSHTARSGQKIAYSRRDQLCVLHLAWVAFPWMEFVQSGGRWPRSLSSLSILTIKSTESWPLAVSIARITREDSVHTNLVSTIVWSLVICNQCVCWCPSALCVCPTNVCVVVWSIWELLCTPRMEWWSHRFSSKVLGPSAPATCRLCAGGSSSTSKSSKSYMEFYFHCDFLLAEENRGSHTARSGQEPHSAGGTMPGPGRTAGPTLRGAARNRRLQEGPRVELFFGFGGRRWGAFLRLPLWQ